MNNLHSVESNFIYYREGTLLLIINNST